MCRLPGPHRDPAARLARGLAGLGALGPAVAVAGPSSRVQGSRVWGLIRAVFGEQPGEPCVDPTVRTPPTLAHFFANHPPTPPPPLPLLPSPTLLPPLCLLLLPPRSRPAPVPHGPDPPLTALTRPKPAPCNLAYTGVGLSSSVDLTARFRTIEFRGFLRHPPSFTEAAK